MEKPEIGTKAIDKNEERENKRKLAQIRMKLTEYIKGSNDFFDDAKIPNAKNILIGLSDCANTNMAVLGDRNKIKPPHIKLKFVQDHIDERIVCRVIFEARNWKYDVLIRLDENSIMTTKKGTQVIVPRYDIDGKHVLKKGNK